LRVGFSTVKGLAVGLNISFNAVSVLDALLEFDNVEKMSTKCAFISIGGGKIAYKSSFEEAVKTMRLDDFVLETDRSNGTLFITTKDTYDIILQTKSQMNFNGVSSNELLQLIYIAAQKEQFVDKEIIYQG
jgi:tRNA A37 threonylcarbamoyladenosine modification protein TsaB